jgi:hypothetical protein
LKRVVDKRIVLILLVLVMALVITLPSTTLGAGDDCPDPGVSPPQDPGDVDNGNDNPTGPPPEDTTETDDSGDEGEGVFGSLGGSLGGQGGITVLMIVAIAIGGVAYFVMMTRGEDPEE